MNDPARAAAAVEAVFRAEWGRVLAHLTGFLGDWDTAEEATQEAFAIAAERWDREGLPAHPRAWLLVTARNRAIDRIRRDRRLAEKLARLERREPTEQPMSEPEEIPDERLELIFACCHPALGREAQVALTLRALLGLSTEEIARAFLVSEETMKRRLSRAKAKIRDAGIPFAVPSGAQLTARLSAVLAIVYLVYNEGYSGRLDLASEALRLGRVMCELMPDEPEACGLMALMLAHHARRAARFHGGELVLLADQDRSLYDADELEAAHAELERAIALHGRGPYVVQAAIALLHAEPKPDWSQIVALYERLSGLTASPVVKLNQAVALAEAGAPAEALARVDRLELGDYRYLHSTRAELLRRVGRTQEAREAFARALELAASEPERRFLRRRLAEL